MFYIPSYNKTLIIEIDNDKKKEEIVKFLKFKNCKELNIPKEDVISIDIFLKSKSFGYNNIEKITGLEH